MQTKPIVRYSHFIRPPVVGESCVLYPLDHPDVYRVSNTTWAMTSPVVSFDADSGVIETQNTLYHPEELVSER
jgi:hypothetical protein